MTLFQTLMGGTLDTALHADDLGVGALTAWASRRNGQAGAVTGSPTADATGWGGTRRTLPTSATVRVDLDALAPAYAANTSFTWIMAYLANASAAVRNLAFLGSSSASNRWRGVQINPADVFILASNKNGTSVNASSLPTTVEEGLRTVLAVSYDGAVGTFSAVEITSAGTTTLCNAVASSSAGTLTVDRFSVGALCANGAYSGYWNGHLRMFAAARVARDVAQLTTLAQFTRDRLGCPVT